jgi:exopolysaccharide biosynthesis polyprenyl glycosylphosphotransferase
LNINRHRKVSLILLAFDLLSVALIFNVVSYLKHVTSEPFLWPFLVPGFIFVLSLHLIDGYGASSDMMSLDYASLHLIASFSATLATILLTYGFISAGFELQSSRAAIVLSFGLLAPISLFYRRLIYSRTRESHGEQNLLFVGDEDDFDLFSAECERMNMHRPLVHVEPKDNFTALQAVLDSISESRLRVEAIVIKESGRELPSHLSLKLVQLYFQGIPTYTLEIFHQVYWRKIPLYRINPIWLLQDGFQIAREPVFERIKRGSDIALSIIGLILSAPFVAAAAIAIKFDDGGSVFFSQSRIGRHRVPFNLLKLRTMHERKGTGDPYTRPGDARVTRVGRLLRSGRLDELPQLWNVLMGQMSLIGPRAEWDRLVAEYEREIPSYHFRHLVKPGITGWAQVNYRYGTGIQDTLRKLEYDLYYIRNFSFMLDASIVLKTLHVMLFQKGH